jgi:hypothetical protein
MNQLANPDLILVGQELLVPYANEMDENTQPAPGTVLIRPGLNFRLHVAGHTLESASLVSGQCHWPGG